MDYRQFRIDHGLKGDDVVAVIKPICRKFSKGTLSFAEQPDKYGLCLLPSLDKLLIERFGGQVKEEPVKAQPKRTKPNRFVVYLPDDLAEKVKKIRAAQGCTTQELLSDLIENWLIATEET